jgi:hypothetical protein
MATIFVTCLLVWISLRMFNIEISDFWVRSKKDDANQAEAPEVPGANDDANQGEAVAMPAGNNANQAGLAGLEVRRKSWRERLHIGNGQAAGQANREVAEP